MRIMTTSHDLYCRLIRCIVLNSYKNLFSTNETIPSEIANICLSAMSSKSTDLRERINEFHYFVKVYRKKIIRDCEFYYEQEPFIVKTPKQETEDRVFEFFDENREELISRKKSGKLPTMIPTSALQQAAKWVQGIHIDYKSHDKCERHMYWAYRGIAIKWWQSRVTNEENGQRKCDNAENAIGLQDFSNRESGDDRLPLRKRTHEDMESDGESSSTDESQDENENDIPKDSGRKSPEVFRVRSEKHFRFLMQLEQKKKQKMMLQGI